MACQHKNSINYYKISSYDIILLDLTFVRRVFIISLCLFLTLFCDSQPKILEQNISGFDRAGSALHYPAQLVFADTGFLGNPVSGLAAALDTFSDSINYHANNHISKFLHTQYILLLGSCQVQNYQKFIFFLQLFHVSRSGTG